MAGSAFRAYVTRHWRALGLAAAVGAALVLGLFGAAALATIYFGLFDTTATTPHNPIVSWASHATFIHSVRRRTANEGIRAPAAFTPEQVRAGLTQYGADCASCHGAPGVARAPWVRQMTPTPPYVVDSARRYTPAQLYFIVEHGAKMTAMPAWGETRTPAQLWNYVALLEAMPNMAPSDFARMRDPSPVPPSAAPQSAPGHVPAD